MLALLVILFAALLSYLIGSFPTAYLVVKRFAHKNILDYGTGNVGTMNTHRATNNKYLTGLVFLGDHLKGILAFAIAYFGAGLLDNDMRWIYALYATTFFFVILGHNYSAWLGFKGGKGLATAAGYFIFFNPWLYMSWVIFFLATVLITKYMVISQLVATAILCAFVWQFFHFQFWIVLFPAVLIIIKHSPRILTVLNGKEPTFYYSEHRKKKMHKASKSTKKV